MIHNLCLYINIDLDSIWEWFEMAHGHKIQIQSADIIALNTLPGSESAYMYFYNVPYCPELDSNLLSLGKLKKKVFQFVEK